MSASNRTNDADFVRELAAILREADLGEIEVERDNLKVRVSRASSVVAQTYAVPAPVQMPAAAAPTAGPVPVAGPAPAVPQGDAPGTVRSPMVGTAYLSADPNSPAFAPLGKVVAAGDTIMLIEAMKTFNPITAPTAGTVQAVLVSNEQPVEYDQPLFVIA
jgi:acetyl-CoA carboxylase biotin carboxyl carrier protein